MLCQNVETFPCSDGSLIPALQRCDNMIDCPDGSDEHPMLCSGSATFVCNDGTSIDVERRCDGNDDCPDGSDEICGN
jgi:hypothetical protein